jgi:hypothetical protein
MTGSALDYTVPIAPQALLDLGITTVSRYLAPVALPKVVRATEYNQLVNAGITVYLNWENFSGDWLGSMVEAHNDATEALRQAKALNYPTWLPITGSCDFDVQRMGEIDVYANTFRDTIHKGGYPVGVYAAVNVIDYCAAIGFDFFWQSMSTAFANGNNAHLSPNTNWWQRRGMKIGNVLGDVSEIRKPFEGGFMLSDPNAQDIVAGVTNAQVLADIWNFTALLADPATPPTGRANDRFHFPPVIMEAAKAAGGGAALTAQQSADVHTIAEALRKLGIAV